MARVKFSPIVTDISGSLSGVTFQRNKFGNTVRQKPIPVNLSSTSQYNIRQKIATIQNAWQDLSDSQRLQWNRFLDYSGQTIKHSSSVKLSGHSLYIKYQLYRLLAGLSLMTTITYLPPPPPAAIVGVTVDVDSLQVELSETIDHTEEFFLFSMSNIRSESQAVSHRGLRYMSVVMATASVFQFKEAYKAAFGILPPVDSWFHYSILTFSVLSPVYTGKTYGRYIVEA